MTATPAHTTCIVALLVGESEVLHHEAVSLLQALRHFHQGADSSNRIHIVIDGPRWQSALADALSLMSSVTISVLETETHLPAVLINHALQQIDADYFSLLWPGAEVSTWYANRADLLAAAVSHPSIMVAGYRGPGERRRFATQSWLNHPDDIFPVDYQRAWLQMADLVPMGNALIHTPSAKKLGLFSEAPLMQRLFWWEWCLRVASIQPPHNLPLQPLPVRDWHSYPFRQNLAPPTDIGWRIVMHAQGGKGRPNPLTEGETRAILFNNFNPQTVARIRLRAPTQAETLPALTALESARDDPLWQTLSAALRQRLEALCGQRPLRITLLGGINETANLQLGFINYFDAVRDWGLLSWRWVWDEIAHPTDLAQSDLVIFCRIRSHNGCRLMDFCAANRIPTLYMLDDNWLTLGRDWPTDYANVFMPGCPPYENFLHCLRQADTALAYNALLAADLQEYARHVVVLPTSLDLSYFDQPSRPQHRPITIGYVGTIRKNRQSFQALVQVAQQRTDVRLFVMSNHYPQELAALPPERVTFHGFQHNYATYARMVCDARPDILIAPLGTTRWEATICPNKYLEITACGAAGIYSRVEPYLSYVQEGETGLMVGDTVDEWVAALLRLIDDGALRERLAQGAMADIRRRFDLKVVLPEFLALILDAAGYPNDSLSKSKR
ncbi:MAG: glycosyltransferase family 4 protein [Betaproteobacteria bacterium]|nr:glycosyltransferase family 4 protein [Betaproteobacteria bacterium]